MRGTWCVVGLGLPNRLGLTGTGREIVLVLPRWINTPILHCLLINAFIVHCPLINAFIVHWSMLSLSIDQCLHCLLINAFIVYWSMPSFSIDQCLHCPLINAFIVHWSMPSFSIDQCLHCLLINAFIVYWSIPSLSTDQCLHCLLINASLCIDKALARSCAVKCDIQQEQCWVPHQILNATQSIVLHLSAPHTVAYPHPPTSLLSVACFNPSKG